MNTEEIKAAEQYLHDHPVLHQSPGDLKRTGRTVEEYLRDFAPEDQELYYSYYEDEL